jgi:hypothetical protein
MRSIIPALAPRAGIMVRLKVLRILAFELCRLPFAKAVGILENSWGNMGLDAVSRKWIG